MESKQGHRSMLRIQPLEKKKMETALFKGVHSAVFFLFCLFKQKGKSQTWKKKAFESESSQF